MSPWAVSPRSKDTICLSTSAASLKKSLILSFGSWAAVSWAPLRRKLEDAGIKSVRMLGSRDNPYPYLAAADWFISSSASECHPIALQEALILGIPVVASSCSAVVETLDPRFGILAEHDRQGLREGLREILLRPELTEKCRGNIRAFYDKNSVWEARLEAICELMGE